MPAPEFFETVVDWFADVFSPFGTLFPRATRGLGVVHISADTALDGSTPRPTDLRTAPRQREPGQPGVDVGSRPSKQHITIEFPSHDHLVYGSHLELVPPEGFRFVQEVPDFVVTPENTRVWDPDEPDAPDLTPIPGMAAFTTDGRVRWEARGAPNDRYFGKMLAIIGRKTPILIQPVSGVDAADKRGPIEIRTDMTFVGWYTIRSGVGELILDSGRVSPVKSQVDADPATIIANGLERSDVTLYTQDGFGNPTDRGVDDVALVRVPELGTVDPPLARASAGLWNAGITARVPTVTVLVSGLLNGTETISGRELGIYGVDLGLQISADVEEPAVGNTVALTITVANQGQVQATGVGVRLELGSDLEFQIVTTGSPGAHELVGPGVLRWDSVTVPRLGEDSFTLDVSLLRVPGSAIDVTAALVASDVADASGAHDGSGTTATVTLTPM